MTKTLMNEGFVYEWHVILLFWWQRVTTGSGKKIKLFATSGGSGFGKTVEELQPSAPGTVIEAWMVNGKE